MLAAYAINRFNEGMWFDGCVFLVIAALFVFICWCLMSFVRQYAEQEMLNIRSVRPMDNEILAFLIAYLLPIISKDVCDLYTNPLCAVFVFVIILLCVYNSNAFHFNPLLGMVGFHFYEVKSDTGIPYMFITRKCIRNEDFATVAKEIGTYIYLDASQP